MAAPADPPALVVIGGGITGLSTAITWALHRDPSREPVILLEEQRVPGGCVSSFRRHGFLFDTTQIVPDVSDLLAYLGVDLPLVRFEGTLCRVILVDPRSGSRTVLPVPSDAVRFREDLLSRYPGQARAIGRFFDLAFLVFDELHNLVVEPRWYQIPALLVNCRHLIAYEGKTYRSLVDSCGVTDPELRDVLDVFASMGGLPSDRVAALLPISAMMVSLAGSCRPARGFAHLPAAMARRLRSLGGTILTRSRAERILVEEGRVSGVRLAGGTEIRSARVVTTIDPIVAMRDLVGMDTLRALDPGYARRIESLRMSTSSLHLSVGLSPGIDLAGLGLDGGYNVVTTGRGAFSRLFDSFDRGVMAHSPDCFHLALECPSLLTGGKPVISVQVTPVPMADWSSLRDSDPAAYRDRKMAMARTFLDLVDRWAVPGLRDRIEVLDVATPATFARWTGASLGQNFDMAPYPDNFGRSRLPTRTPVAGLYQPKFSHGIWPCLTAGLQVVDMMLDHAVMGGRSRYSARRDPPAPRSGA